MGSRDGECGVFRPAGATLKHNRRLVSLETAYWSMCTQGHVQYVDMTSEPQNTYSTCPPSPSNPLPPIMASSPGMVAHEAKPPCTSTILTILFVLAPTWYYPRIPATGRISRYSHPPPPRTVPWVPSRDGGQWRPPQKRFLAAQWLAKYCIFRLGVLKARLTGDPVFQ